MITQDTKTGLHQKKPERDRSNGYITRQYATLKQPVKQEEKPVRITFGIQPRHLEVINTLLAKYNAIDIGGELHPGIMLYSEAFWKEVGEQIGWLPFTIALHYFKYINKTQTLPHDNN